MTKNFSQDNKIPEPPQMEVDIRTMESDLKAFQESGGEVPGTGTRKVFTPRAQEVSGAEPGLKIRGYSGPEKAIFDSEDSTIAAQEINSGTKMIIMVGVVVGIIVGLGLLGYYVIFPLIFE